ncbi:MAG: UvrD-helicase domain-containing protein [Cytophagaceae bacterium]|nr:UvrD-helicase domain-containing protein [Cytophagaceae bacterium]
MSNYLEQLNEAQKEAVTSINGASLVIAGAGSGKTRVLTYRIAHLLNSGVAPWNVLALTFTNKAAHEMKERIARVVGEKTAQYLWMGTFHSIFARILRREAEVLKFPSNFTIYDNADSKSLIKSILKEIKLDEKTYKPGAVLSRISAAKNDLILPSAYANDQNRLVSDKAARMPFVHDIYYRYMKACFKAGAMDFDDLLLNTNLLFRNHPDILAKYREQFQFILVDEYQDTNFSQYLIIKKLAELHHNVCVVGDDAQSIYSFRGAKIENILNFERDYPNYQLFKLEQNYRSTQNIVNAANSIIAKNKGQIRKTVFSENYEGEKIKVLQAYSDSEEGYIVANDINAIRREYPDSFNDFAILYRTNAQSRIFEEALRRHTIPYKIYGGLSFYQRKEIKDVLAYFRMVINPNDGEALKRIINYPARGIGETTIGKLEALVSQHDTTIWNILINPALATVGFNSSTLKKLNSFTTLISDFARLSVNSDAYTLAVEIIAKSGIPKEFHQDKTPENQSRLENIDELLNAIKDFTDKRTESGGESSMAHFLEDVSLLTDQDGDKDVNADAVKLMTIHAAKGLEFKTVYIVGVEENLFPSPMALDSEQGTEEERRLFYVAITRAKERAILSYAKTRYRYGEMTFAKPSRFVSEIDRQYLDLSAAATQMQKTDGFTSFSKERKDFSDAFAKTQKAPVKFNFDEPANPPKHFAGGDFRAGMKVIHDRFGEGVILEIEGIGYDTKATIQFKKAGTKRLLLKFAKLKIER